MRKERIFALTLLLGVAGLCVLSALTTPKREQVKEAKPQEEPMSVDAGIVALQAAASLEDGMLVRFEKEVQSEQQEVVSLDLSCGIEGGDKEPEAVEEAPEEKEEVWEKAIVTAYSNTEDDILVGVDDNRLIDGYSCASFLQGEYGLPYGTIVEIRGYGSFEVVDTAGPDTLEKRSGQCAANGYTAWFDLFFEDATLDWLDQFGEKVLEYRVISMPE